MRFRSAFQRPAFAWKDVAPYKGGQQSHRVSVIIPFGSVDYYDKLSNCIVSIHNQQHISISKIDVILSCVQNEDQDLYDIMKLAQSNEARLVVARKKYTHFPLALARNVGAKVATSNIVCFIDADMILDPEAISRSLTVNNRLVVIFTAYMSKRFNRRSLLSGDADSYRNEVRNGSVNTSGYGGYLMLPTQAFNAVGGHDEVYDVGWGAEDNDFVDRVVEHGIYCGLKLKNLSVDDGIVNAHQWHNRVDHSKDVGTIANRDRYAKLSTITANDNKWGEVPYEILVPVPPDKPSRPKKVVKKRRISKAERSLIGKSFTGQPGQPELLPAASRGGRKSPPLPTVRAQTVRLPELPTVRGPQRSTHKPQKRGKKVRRPLRTRKPLLAENALKKLLATKEGHGSPTLSIIVSCSDDRYAPRLLRCLLAIRGQIGVRHEDVEIIVSSVHEVDSKHGTTKIARLAEQYGVHFCEGTHRKGGYNLSLSRNFGAMRSRGEVLCFLDVDIIMDPEMVRFALAALTKTNYVVSLVMYIPRNASADVYQNTNVEKFRKYVRDGRLGKRGTGGCVFIYRSVYLAVGGWDEAFVGWGGEDNDMGIRLAKMGIQQVNLTDRFGLLGMHQWHPQTRRTEEADLRAENWKRLRKEDKLPAVRNRQTFGGFSAGIVTMMPHHPMRPMACLKKSLRALEKAVNSRHHVVDLYVQGKCKEKLPNPKNFAFELHITQYDENKGLSVPTLESVEKFLDGHHMWWSKVDDDIIIPKDGLEKLISVLEYEDQLGEINVGACQMTTGAGTWVHKPRVFVLSTETVQGKPVLMLQDGHIAERSMGKVRWRVADASGWGSTVFSRRVFESGVRPDTQYFLGVVDIDVFYQMHLRGMRVALVNNPACSQLVNECYNASYKAVRYNPKIIRQSGERFSEKWGVYHRKLVEYKK